MKKITLEENETIEINGAVINVKCAKWLKVYQEDNNSTLIEIREYISESVSSLILAMEYLDEATAEQMFNQAKYLLMTSQNLKNFMKPE